ncbi:MAG: phosphoribosylglycinamide formyltransferase [Bacteroidetes bacterium]|nr:phosphoribosylglycinamide formyltransferase [Bacteroidota bacterium]
MSINIAILASGNGSNAQHIIEYFSKNKKIQFPLIVTNKEDAYVRERIKNLGLNSIYLSKNEITKTNTLLNLLKKNKIDWIVLAGFLLLIPSNIIQAYTNKIINIHPALLPDYGGKGMYGMRVHEAVIDNKDKESGITIHHVNEKYDEGNIIFQSKCEINKNETPETLAVKIHRLEYEYFPKVLEELICK